MRIPLNNFGIKFIDIMIGIVLGLGFQWWTSLEQTWQYIAFIFIYIDIIDYWIDYGPFLKKFPPKSELDIMIDVAIMFNLFLYIFSSQKETLLYFFLSFVGLRVLDMVWIGRAVKEYPEEKTGLKKWIYFNVAEGCAGLVLLVSSLLFTSSFVPLLFIIAFWAIMRTLRTTKFKNMYRA